ncbi:hypothetical protein D1872_236800 [compost metagenome]
MRLRHVFDRGRLIIADLGPFNRILVQVAGKNLNLPEVHKLGEDHRDGIRLLSRGTGGAPAFQPRTAAEQLRDDLVRQHFPSLRIPVKLGHIDGHLIQKLGVKGGIGGESLKKVAKALVAPALPETGQPPLHLGFLI